MPSIHRLPLAPALLILATLTTGCDSTEPSSSAVASARSPLAFSRHDRGDDHGGGHDDDPHERGFNHTRRTSFPLTGKHTTVQCAQCHVNGRFAGTPTSCDACHLAAYNGTTNPNHKTASFPVACERCHSTAQWAGAVFDHTTATSFPLTGKHTTVQCAQCHVNGVFAGTPTSCDACHLAAYNGTTSPNHKTAGFPVACDRCHSTAQWAGAVFDHTTATSFPLTGKHTTVQCAQCHVNGVFAGTPTSCDACHLAAYNGTTSPNHKTAGFPVACERCHSTAQWAGAVFDHTTATSFPLTGKHTTVQCAQCHVNGVFAGTPTSCDACHLAAYNGTTSPNHKTAGFPVACDRCHSTAQWAGAVFDHTTATSFPLTGKHTTVQCAQCHVNGVFAGTPTSCDACHLAAYNGTTSPNHKTAGYSTACSDCHTTATW